MATPPGRPDVERRLERVALIRAIVEEATAHDLALVQRLKDERDALQAKVAALDEQIRTHQCYRADQPPVHLHGPSDGPGLACPERWVGQCRVISEAHVHSSGCIGTFPDCGEEA
jgi:hypothetical protein